MHEEASWLETYVYRGEPCEDDKIRLVKLNSKLHVRRLLTGETLEVTSGMAERLGEIFDICPDWDEDGAWDYLWESLYENVNLECYNEPDNFFDTSAEAGFPKVIERE
jgi:hypothetical protein